MNPARALERLAVSDTDHCRAPWIRQILNAQESLPAGGDAHGRYPANLQDVLLRWRFLAPSRIEGQIDDRYLGIHLTRCPDRVLDHDRDLLRLGRRRSWDWSRQDAPHSEPSHQRKHWRTPYNRRRSRPHADIIRPPVFIHGRACSAGSPMWLPIDGVA